MSENKKTLALSTKRERPIVRIDGVEYPLLAAEDLKLRDALWLEKTSPRISKLSMQVQEEDCPEEVAEQLAELVLRVSDIILAEVPPPVRARLTDMQKLAVIQAYMEGLAEEKEKAAAPFPAAASGAETGSPSSPGSSDSTVGAAPSG